MSFIDRKMKLSRREIVLLRATEVFSPPKTNNIINWLAVIIAINEYDADPSRQSQILAELETSSEQKRRLQEAQDTYYSTFDAKHLIEDLAKKVEDGFKDQADVNKKQATTLTALEKRAQDAEDKQKRQRPWVLAGKVLGGLFGAILAVCTILGVPTKYTQPLIDNIIDPALEKIGLYHRPQQQPSSEKTSGSHPQQRDQEENTRTPSAQNELPNMASIEKTNSSEMPIELKTVCPSTPSKMDEIKNPENDGMLACYRSSFARKRSFRHHRL